MAAEYEVNIKLNTGKAQDQLKDIEASVAKIGKTEKQSVNTTDRRIASLVKLRSIGDDVAQLEQKGVDMGKARFQLDKASEAINKKMFLTANSRLGVAVKHLNTQRGITKELERQQNAQRRQRIKRAEGVALGAGFPLLFGGGPGSVIGGGLGGLTGSFGAQIALSAIGQQVDQFVASVANVGKALTSASGTLELFRDKNLFSSDAVKKHAFELEQQGEMQKLATLLTRDLASQIGVDAVKNFQELGGEVKTFLDTINKLFLAVQAFVAGPLAKLLGAINTVLGGVSTEMEFNRLRSSLTGEAAAEFERIIAEARGTRELTSQERQRAISAGKTGDQLGPVPGKLTKAAMRTALQNPRTAELRQTIDITGQTVLDDTLGFKKTVDAAAKAAQRLLESSQRRIKILKIETAEIKKITNFKNKIAAAELVGDRRGVARLKRDQALAKLKSDEEQAIARINPKLEVEQQNLERINIEARGVAQAAEIRAQFERDIAVIIKDEQNEAIEDQFALATKLAKAREEAVKREEQLYKQLGDTVKSGLVDGIKSAIDGSKTLGDVLGNVLNRLSDQLLQLGANMAFYGNQQGIFQQGAGLIGSLFSAFSPSAGITGQFSAQSSFDATSLFSGLADGGIAKGGRPYVVGERGPELFVPGRTGTVVPNHAMGSSNIVVNVDASGTQAQGDQPNAKALGSAIGAAVQAELIKQKRPGGLLA